MPRYYFDTADGDRDQDNIGTELPSDDRAVSEAIRYAGSLIDDQPSLLQHSPELLVTARSDEKVVAQIRIGVERPG